MKQQNTDNSKIDLLFATPGDRFECRDSSVLVFTNRLEAVPPDGRGYRFEAQCGIPAGGGGRPAEAFRFRNGSFSGTGEISGRDICKKLPRSSTKVNLATATLGKKFRRRDGQEVTLQKIGGQAQGAAGVMRFTAGGICYRSDGSASLHGTESPFDLVAEVYPALPPPAEQPKEEKVPLIDMRPLSVGQRFRRRDGVITRLAETGSNGDYPFKCSDGKDTDTYTVSGFYMKGGSKHPKDLVRVITLPTADVTDKKSAGAALRLLLRKLPAVDAAKAQTLLEILES